MKGILAWYFAPKNNRLKYGDGRLVRVGTTHSVRGTPRACAYGLHASTRIIDALGYAHTSILYRVSLLGEMDIGKDKIAAQSRTYLKRFDIEAVLREFARKQAKINIHKIQAYCSKEKYDLIVEWLATGDKKLQSVAWSAARYVAWSAARSADESAAESVAWSAARSAATNNQEVMLLQLLKDKFGEFNEK